jgi:hypothetical protein
MRVHAGSHEYLEGSEFISGRRDLKVLSIAILKHLPIKANQGNKANKTPSAGRQFKSRLSSHDDTTAPRDERYMQVGI